MEGREYMVSRVLRFWPDPPRPRAIREIWGRRAYVVIPELFLASQARYTRRRQSRQICAPTLISTSTVSEVHFVAA